LVYNGLKMYVQNFNRRATQLKKIGYQYERSPIVLKIADRCYLKKNNFIYTDNYFLVDCSFSCDCP
jgi:hypothetical protein